MAKHHLIANYHYVENPREDRKGIWPCSVAEFERQIKWLSENYKIVSAGEVYEAAQKNADEKLCAITFDDGLKDQYINAVPILKKYGVRAAFFIISSSFEWKIPGTHKLHIILSHLSAESLIDIFNSDNELISKYAPIPKDERINLERRLFEDTQTANLKEKLLGQIPADLKDKFLNSIFFKTLGLNEKEHAGELFMSEAEVRNLGKEGFTIGSHGHGHYALNNLDAQSAGDDIKKSADILNNLLGVRPEVFSYPNGRYNESLISVLEDEGFKYAFSIEAREVTKGESPYTIPRFDTNDIKKIML